MKRLLLVFIAGMLFNSCSNKNESANDNVNTVAENTLADDAKVDDTIEPGVFIQDNNIYFTFENGTIKQLTFNKTDESPILLPDNENVFFVRNVDMVSYVRKNLMIVNLDDLKERAIQDKKPEKDGLDQTHEILRVENPKLSVDGEHVYFISERYATASQLAKVNLKTGNWEELLLAESFELLDEYPHVGYILAPTSEISKDGRKAFFRLYDVQGEIAKEFYNEEAVDEFRKSQGL